MKIAIVGSREFKDKNLVIRVVRDIAHPGYTIISGGAIGVDKWAEEYFDNLGFEKIIFLPDWNKYGKSAGFKRNELIINEADRVLAFWDGRSKGTKHSIDLAIKTGKPLDIYVRQ